jgi:hypothetical protein
MEATSIRMSSDGDTYRG